MGAVVRPLEKSRDARSQRAWPDGAENLILALFGSDMLPAKKRLLRVRAWACAEVGMMVDLRQGEVLGWV